MTLIIKVYFPTIHVHESESMRMLHPFFLSPEERGSMLNVVVLVTLVTWKAMNIVYQVSKLSWYPPKY